MLSKQFIDEVESYCRDSWYVSVIEDFIVFTAVDKTKSDSFIYHFCNPKTMQTMEDFDESHKYVCKNGIHINLCKNCLTTIPKEVKCVFKLGILNI